MYVRIHLQRLTLLVDLQPKTKQQEHTTRVYKSEMAQFDTIWNSAYLLDAYHPGMDVKLDELDEEAGTVQNKAQHNEHEKNVIPTLAVPTILVLPQMFFEGKRTAQ